MKVKFVFLCLCFIACRSTQEKNVSNGKQEIWAADSSMNALAGQIGFNNALLQYADSSMVKLSDGGSTLIGVQNFAASFDATKDIKTIVWKPLFADVAQSSDLGYTWGNWKLTLPDTTFYGKYFTVWKKNRNGEWKVVLDGGNSSPTPEH